MPKRKRDEQPPVLRPVDGTIDDELSHYSGELAATFSQTKKLPIALLARIYHVLPRATVITPLKMEARIRITQLGAKAFRDGDLQLFWESQDGMDLTYPKFKKHVRRLNIDDLMDIFEALLDEHRSRTLSAPMSKEMVLHDLKAYLDVDTQEVPTHESSAEELAIQEVLSQPGLLEELNDFGEGFDALVKVVTLVTQSAANHSLGHSTPLDITMEERSKSISRTPVPSVLEEPQNNDPVLEPIEGASAADKEEPELEIQRQASPKPPYIVKGMVLCSHKGCKTRMRQKKLKRHERKKHERCEKCTEAYIFSVHYPHICNREGRKLEEIVQSTIQGVHESDGVEVEASKNTGSPIWDNVPRPMESQPTGAISIFSHSVPETYEQPDTISDDSFHTSQEESRGENSPAQQSNIETLTDANSNQHARSDRKRRQRSADLRLDEIRPAKKQALSHDYPCEPVDMQEHLLHHGGSYVENQEIETGNLVASNETTFAVAHHKSPDPSRSRLQKDEDSNSSPSNNSERIGRASHEPDCDPMSLTTTPPRHRSPSLELGETFMNHVILDPNHVVAETPQHQRTAIIDDEAEDETEGETEDEDEISMRSETPLMETPHDPDDENKGSSKSVFHFPMIRQIQRQAMRAGQMLRI